MLSRNEDKKDALWGFFPDRLRNMQISTKMTLIYTGLILLLLICVSIATFCGMYRVLHGQAAEEITGSIKRTQQMIESSDICTPGYHRAYQHGLQQDNSHTLGKLREALMPGVILRVEDANGNIVLNTDDKYLTTSEIKAGETEDNSLLNYLFITKGYKNTADSKYTRNYKYSRDSRGRISMYFTAVPMVIDGETYTFNYVKVITAEVQYLIDFKRLLFVEIICGMLLLLFVANFVSRRMLKPIRTLTDTAQSIQVADMSSRIEVPPTGDEVARLAVTFNQMLDRIECGYKQQQKFVSDASHELRTPVTVIKGYADMLARWGAEDKESFNEGITAIRSEAEDMHSLIEKLLFLARADQKRQILKKEIMDMQPVLDEVYKKLSLVADKHTISLLNNESGEVFADKVTMKQMLRIFLENSMKYTPAGGHITMASYREKDYLRVELADDGVGIAKEDQAKIFQRFYRVDSSRTKAAGTPGGTGLGLSIAQWIADKHDIKISLDSELGKGSKFILRIPLAEEA